MLTFMICLQRFPCIDHEQSLEQILILDSRLCVCDYYPYGLQPLEKGAPYCQTQQPHAMKWNKCIPLSLLEKIHSHMHRDQASNQWRSVLSFVYQPSHKVGVHRDVNPRSCQLKLNMASFNGTKRFLAG